MARTASHVTIDQDEIRSWVEARGGHPAIVARTRDAEGGGVLRIDYPGFSGEEALEPISWDEFFRVFAERALAFVCSDDPASRFAKLVARGDDVQ